IQVTLDVARDDRDDAATGADVEVGAPRAELVGPSLRRIAHRHPEHAARIGGPHAAVLRAEGAIAGPRRDFRRVGLPHERERDVAAVTTTVDEHARSLRTAFYRSVVDRAPRGLGPRGLAFLAGQAAD